MHQLADFETFIVRDAGGGRFRAFCPSLGLSTPWAPFLDEIVDRIAVDIATEAARRVQERQELPERGRGAAVLLLRLLALLGRLRAQPRVVRVVLPFGFLAPGDASIPGADYRAEAAGL